MSSPPFFYFPSSPLFSPSSPHSALAFPSLTTTVTPLAQKIRKTTLFSPPSVTILHHCLNERPSSVVVLRLNLSNK
ncbi:conserved hypothetical protein [Ricinus communis]|uniref:Uncharacterized protein n=1 Tax=Ricinus communis TaxID=3988 RepID=B9SCG3_RICCO|nr:conserved hypothetical protein [Ricinus communis]